MWIAEKLWDQELLLAITRLEEQTWWDRIGSSRVALANIDLTLRRD